ncbi:hypothetical protein D3C72_1625730 [compost metagenome]
MVFLYCTAAVGIPNYSRNRRIAAGIGIGRQGARIPNGVAVAGFGIFRTCQRQRLLLCRRKRCTESILGDLRDLRVGKDFLNHMLRHITHAFGGMGEVLLQQSRIAGIQL